MNLNGEEYFYIRNIQGDIIGLIDETGAEVVSYTYDTWGKVISITGSLASTVGEKNPYLYRGYRYDSETGLYYLQARYYNPEWGRFLNADNFGGDTGSLLSHNVFAYCMNNPVNLSDPSGHFIQFLIPAAILVARVALAAIAIYDAYNSAKNIYNAYQQGGTSAARNPLTMLKLIMVCPGSIRIGLQTEVILRQESRHRFSTALSLGGLYKKD